MDIKEIEWKSIMADIKHFIDKYERLDIDVKLIFKNTVDPDHTEKWFTVDTLQIAIVVDSRAVFQTAKDEVVLDLWVLVEKYQCSYVLYLFAVEGSDIPEGIHTESFRNLKKNRVVDEAGKELVVDLDVTDDIDIEVNLEDVGEVEGISLKELLEDIEEVEVKE